MLNEKDLQKVRAIGSAYDHEFSLSDNGEMSFGSTSIGTFSADTPTELACLLIEKAESFGREETWGRVLAGNKAADAIADTARIRALLVGFAVAIAEAFELKTTICGTPHKQNGIRIEHTPFCTKVSFLAAPETAFLVSAHGDSLPERMRDAARWSKNEEYHNVLHKCHENGICVETAWKAHILCERMAYFFRHGLSAAFLGVPKAA